MSTHICAHRPGRSCQVERFQWVWNAIGEGWGEQRDQLSGPGVIFWAVEESLGGLCPPSRPLSVHQLQGCWPEHTGCAWLSASGELGTCDFETWPFSVLFVQKKFHPGSLQWLLRIRRTLGRLGYRTALKAVLGNLKRACFSLSDFKLHSSLLS